MKNKTIFTALLTGTLLAGVTLSPAIAGRGAGNCDDVDSARHQERRAERMEHRLDKMATILELTATQQKQIGAIMTAQQAKHKDQFQQRSADRQQIRDMKSSMTFDEAAFRAQAEKRAAERIDMQVERMKTRQQIFALLTPEQQEKAEFLFAKKDNRGPGHGMKH